MADVSPVSLVLSLAFGVGQVIVGLGVARWVLLARRWRKASLFVLLLLALWFVCSGIAELFVSGMETLRLITRWPALAAFTLWRGRADAALLAATVVLLAALLAHAAVSLVSRRRRPAGPSVPGPGSRESDASNGRFPAGGN
jgi:hypothetical protein